MRGSPAMRRRTGRPQGPVRAEAQARFSGKRRKERRSQSAGGASPAASPGASPAGALAAGRLTRTVGAGGLELAHVLADGGDLGAHVVGGRVVPRLVARAALRLALHLAQHVHELLVVHARELVQVVFHRLARTCVHGLELAAHDRVEHGARVDLRRDLVDVTDDVLDRRSPLGMILMRPSTVSSTRSMLR